MSAEYNVELNQEQIQSAIALYEFAGNNIADAIRIATTKTAQKTRHEARKQIRSQIRLSASYVFSHLKIKRATKSNLSGKITTPSRGIMLAYFSNDPAVPAEKVSWYKAPITPKEGIFTQIKTNGAAKKVKGKHGGSVFYTLLNNRKTLAIAERIPGTKKIKVLHGPSLSQVFTDVRGDVLPMAKDEYQKQMLAAMEYIVRKQHAPEPGEDDA